ncbi:MAG: hypothetical protein OEZ06_29610 [Myxococcales bacterium]|nr:hypothetical protein [Myxococcales bacterium]
MYVFCRHFHSSLALALLLVGPLACRNESPPSSADGGEPMGTKGGADEAPLKPPAPTDICNEVVINDMQVIVREESVVAKLSQSAPFANVVMLFGGEEMKHNDAVRTVAILGLDQTDAIEAAKTYPDFDLCSSAGAEDEAIQAKLKQIDFVPATCEIHEAIVAALEVFETNRDTMGDRTSLRLEGAMLQLQSASVQDTDEDVTNRYTGLELLLVTDVEQLTGKSVIELGTSTSGT